MQDYLSYVVCAYGFAFVVLCFIALQSIWQWRKVKKHLK